MPDLTTIIDEDAARVARAVDLSPLDGSSILITGASGLLGLYLIACMRQRMRVTGKPIHVTAVTRAAPPAAFAHLFDMPHLQLCQVDLADPDATRTLPEAEHVIHAAGYGQPQKFLLDPAKTIRLNTDATLTLLERLPPGGKFLFLSSSEVYSGSPRTPHREEDIGTTDPGHVRACYIEGKRCGEAICHAVRAQGRAVKAARLALAYGPGTRTDDQRVLNILIRRALVDGRVTLLDGGAARRSYGYVGDVVEISPGDPASWPRGGLQRRRAVQRHDPGTGPGHRPHPRSADPGAGRSTGRRRRSGRRGARSHACLRRVRQDGLRAAARGSEPDDRLAARTLRGYSPQPRARRFSKDDACRQRMRR